MALTPILLHRVSRFLQVALERIILRPRGRIPQRRQRGVSFLCFGLVRAVSGVFGLISGRHVDFLDTQLSLKRLAMKERVR